ncbi:MAG: type I-C CRISPR-associated protein Cas5c [Sedimentisphaerales bacterium]|jgi:CRISPR-associated protein Cas5d|nr:type I-C CRISPR-associated protein Cas5c [Sedimentisphaerales bacterium]
MNTIDNRITIRVWGDYACFTRPEMKVERVSYPICTPSAARGILEAIYWEPQMYYVIDSISVVKKGRWFSFRRNEITQVINSNQAWPWMQGKTPVKYVLSGGGSPDAAQRNMLALADVEYLITAEVRPTSLYNPSRGDFPKYLREIRCRAEKGKCCHRPALGCREFAADFEWVDDASQIKLAEWKEEDLGLMLYDVFDVDERANGFHWVSDTDYEGTMVVAKACFFHAVIKDARMDCHPDRVEILRPRKEVN